MIVLWTLLSFLSGSLMFSYWLGLIARQRLEAVGDGNPGGLNLWRAAGYRYGLCGIALDFLKGYLPVLLLQSAGAVPLHQLAPVAVAPVAGHVFSPFLKGRGGKAIAATFGVWSALTGFEASLAYAVILAALQLLAYLVNKRAYASSAWSAVQVLSGLALLLGYLLWRRADGVWLEAWLGHFLLLVYAHRREWRSLVKARTESDRSA